MTNVVFLRNDDPNRDPRHYGDLYVHRSSTLVAGWTARLDDVLYSRGRCQIYERSELTAASVQFSGVSAYQLSRSTLFHMQKPSRCYIALADATEDKCGQISLYLHHAFTSTIELTEYTGLMFGILEV